MQSLKNGVFWMLCHVALVALSSSETSVLTRATRHNIPEDGILHGHRRENFKSYAKFKILLNPNFIFCIQI
jgi:hypothetical protein